MAERRRTKEVRIGDVIIGGNHPIAIQSMTNTKTQDVEATVAQILQLERAGCQIIRCTVPDMEAAKALAEIKKQIHIPLVADIHFDYRLAIAAMENGADKIRINPGNIGSAERVKAVVDCARERNIPIRVGVNSGSLEKELVEKYHGVTAEGIVESALDKVKMIEDFGYDNLVMKMLESNEAVAAGGNRTVSDAEIASFNRMHEELNRSMRIFQVGIYDDEKKCFHGGLNDEPVEVTLETLTESAFDKLLDANKDVPAGALAVLYDKMVK